MNSNITKARLHEKGSTDKHQIYFFS